MKMIEYFSLSLIFIFSTSCSLVTHKSEYETGKESMVSGEVVSVQKSDHTYYYRIVIKLPNNEIRKFKLIESPAPVYVMAVLPSEGINIREGENIEFAGIVKSKSNEIEVRRISTLEGGDVYKTLSEGYLDVFVDAKWIGKWSDANRLAKLKRLSEEKASALKSEEQKRKRIQQNIQAAKKLRIKEANVYKKCLAIDKKIKKINDKLKPLSVQTHPYQMKKLYKEHNELNSKYSFQYKCEKFHISDEL